MNIVLLLFFFLMAYVFIYEKWPVDPGKLLILLLKLKYTILNICTINKSSNRTVNTLQLTEEKYPTLVIENFDTNEFDNKCVHNTDEPLFNYTITTNDDKKMLSSKKKRPFINNLSTWYNNSYSKKPIVDNNNDIGIFDNSINTSEIYYNENSDINIDKYINSNKPISEIYDKLVDESYTFIP